MLACWSRVVRFGRVELMVLLDGVVLQECAQAFGCTLANRLLFSSLAKPA